MAAPLPLRSDFDADMLRREAQTPRATCRAVAAAQALKSARAACAIRPPTGFCTVPGFAELRRIALRGEPGHPRTMRMRVARQPVRLLATALVALAMALLGAAHAPPQTADVLAWTAPDGGALELCLDARGHDGDAAAAHDCPACTLIAGAAPPPAPPSAPPPRLEGLSAAPPTGPPAPRADVWRPHGSRSPPNLSA